jgi:hypothetical protein
LTRADALDEQAQKYQQVLIARASFLLSQSLILGLGDPLQMPQLLPRLRASAIFNYRSEIGKTRPQSVSGRAVGNPAEVGTPAFRRPSGREHRLQKFECEAM